VLMRRPRSIRPALLLLLGLVFPLLSACPKQQPPEDAGASAPVEPSLQITSLKPASTIAAEPVTVTARGIGFVQGSKVYLGTIEARGVDVFGGGELTFRAAESLEVGDYDVRVVTPAGEQAVAPSSFSVRPRPEESSDCSLELVRFEFAESQLSAAVRSSLSANAECIEAQKFSSVRLEGHADERGSTIFNLSLGEERAEAVRDYLIDLGVDRGVFTIVSYGEERPVMRGFNEESWSENRRVEFAVQ
jgi:peptidoglycan-associated lipoprotein